MDYEATYQAVIEIGNRLHNERKFELLFCYTLATQILRLTIEDNRNKIIETAMNEAAKNIHNN